MTCGKLATCGVDVGAAVAAHGRIDAEANQSVGEFAHALG